MLSGLCGLLLLAVMARLTYRKLFGLYAWNHIILARVIWVVHGGSGAYRGPLPPTNLGLQLQFFDFMKAEVFLREIYLAAKIL